MSDQTNDAPVTLIRTPYAWANSASALMTRDDATPAIAPDDQVRRQGRVVMMRNAYARATDEELAADSMEYRDDWALLQGDLRAGDYEDADTLRIHIAYVEWHIQTIDHEMRRRLRSRVVKRGFEPVVDWTARFDAARQVSIVEGLELLGVELKQQGREWKAHCPFHEDKTPSFSVNEQKNVWICYSCQRGGDLVEFVVLREGKSKGAALAWVEAMLGSIVGGSWHRPTETP